MDQLLRRLLPVLEDHLSDDRMASLFCHELSFFERLIVRMHLARCWQCRIRQEDLEGRRADRMLDFYGEAIRDEEFLMPMKPRVEFAQRLEIHIQNAVPRRRRSFRIPKIAFLEPSLMNPTLAICMVLGFAAAISFFMWWQHRTPDISSNALLVRAERWDTSSLATSAGVVYQAVRITAPKQTLERSIYRDLQGKRKLKRANMVEKEEQLRVALTQAGLDWDEPLSASGYQRWHDRQHVREDHIVRTGTHLLRLTTTVPDGSVSEQSLTVRDTDFHPVRRTVAFRNSGTVEIAELDFKILAWASVDASVFEPANSMLHTVAMTPPRILPFPRIPEAPSAEQLDEAELTTRLILNQLHADTGEQIEISRTPQAVEMKGLVETDERKRTLKTQLQSVPHLTVSIQSVADIKNDPSTDEETTSIKMASMPDQPSPLETYLLVRGHSINDINTLAQQLFNNALAISQESKAISDLQTRFAPEVQKTIVESAALSDLIYSHHERLQGALKQERKLLGTMQVAARAQREDASLEAPSLMEASARNQSLCKELTQTTSVDARGAEKILAEVSMALDDLTVEAHETYTKSQGNSTLSGKK